MSDFDARRALLELAADHGEIANATIKRSLDFTSFLEIEALEVTGVSTDEWGAVLFTFADASLPQIAIHGYDITAYVTGSDTPVSKLINAVTCAYEADEIAERAEEQDDDEDEED